MNRLLPDLPGYFKSGSPLTYVRDLKCPVFIAHAHDDDNEPFKNTKAYVEALKRAGGKVTFEERTSGGHYDEMLQECLPKSVEWATR